jgi:uncharacterized membrane protein YhaH (DUF805 family)
VLTFGMLGSAMSGAMAGQTEPTAGFGSMIAVIGIVGLFFFVYSIVLLVFYCLPGTKGSNKYGSDPYGDDIEQVFA